MSLSRRRSQFVVAGDNIQRDGSRIVSMSYFGSAKWLQAERRYLEREYKGSGTEEFSRSRAIGLMQLSPRTITGEKH